MTTPSPPRSRWRLELEALGACLVTGTVVAGIIILLAHFAGYGDDPALRWILVVVASLTGVTVANAYLKNRGVEVWPPRR